MTQSIIAYERTREEELYPTIKAYWLNSGALWIIKSREIEIEEKKIEDYQSVTLIPSELKEILKLGEGSFECSKRIYFKERVTPGLFPKMEIVSVIAHINGDIEIKQHEKGLNSLVSTIILSFGEWKTILSKCQKRGREWCGEFTIPSGGGLLGTNIVEEEQDIDIDDISE